MARLSVMDKMVHYYSPLIYHTNSEELRDHYTKIFEEAGITNFQFKITK